MDLNFGRHSYTLRSLPASSQRLLNLYSEQEPEDARSPLILRSTAGLRLFATAGAGPVRGLITMNDVLYAVSGSTAYRIASDGTATSLGTIAGTDPVTMATNGSQIAVVADTTTYVVTSSTVNAVTDPDFPGAGTVDYLDGFGIFNRPSTGTFFISALLDMSNFDALDFASAESSPDPLVRVLVDHRELWLFGSHSTEIWVNTGAAAFPFERQPGSIMERGCAAPLSVCKLDNTVMWLADDGVVYRAQGYAPSRISTHAIEEAVADAAITDREAARACAWTQDGHAFYALSIPNTGTYCFDAATGLWHERGSWNRSTWRVGSVVRCYGKILGGDDTTGAIHQLDPSCYLEGTDPHIRLVDSPPMHASGAWAFQARLEVNMETGVGLSSGQGSAPLAMLQVSDDGGRTFGTERTTSIGAIGQHHARAKWDRLGRFRNRVLRVSVSDPVPVTIFGATAEIAGGLL
jgi:hypothetical protein